MQWISVEDRLPETVLVCLVYDGQSEKVGVREFANKQFYSIDSDGEDGLCSNYITHWMPMPEPPAEE